MFPNQIKDGGQPTTWIGREEVKVLNRAADGDVFHPESIGVYKCFNRPTPLFTFLQKPMVLKSGRLVNLQPALVPLLIMPHSQYIV